MPFYIRAGKCLPITATEVMVDLKTPPLAIFDATDPAQSNYFRFRLSPEVVISRWCARQARGRRNARRAGRADRAPRARERGSPYERLLGDAMRGDASLFTRDDSVEAAWRVVDPILHNPAPVIEYEPGTWGPPSAARVIRRRRLARPAARDARCNRQARRRAPSYGVVMLGLPRDKAPARASKLPDIGESSSMRLAGVGEGAAYTTRSSPITVTTSP